MMKRKECMNWMDVDGVTYSADGTKLIKGNLDLREYVVPAGVVEISDEAFVAGCGRAAKLEQIVLPEGLELIGANAFKNCESLHTIELPKGLYEHVVAESN